MKNFKLEIENLLTLEECNEIITLGEDTGFELSSIRTAKGDVIREDIRNNGRVIVNGLEGNILSSEFFDRIKDQIPIVDGYKLKGLNEQIKIYKYDEGQAFNMHRDAPYIRNENERSFFTFMIYLNEGFTGGDTFFLSGSVIPKTGNALLFWQDQLHAGVEVTKGVKYAIRTDVMFSKA